MKTKKALLICLVIISSNCANKLSVVHKDNVFGVQGNIAPERQCILDIWSICSTQNSDGSYILYYSCPKIHFLQDGSGELVFPGRNCFFQWAMVEGIIVFSFNSKEDEKSFISKDTKFKLNLYNENKLQYLELIQTENRYKYFLSRIRPPDECSVQ